MDRYSHPHAADYVRETRTADLAPLRDRFLSAVRARRDPGSLDVLDVGCGSGRDVRAFLEAGCGVEAIDASADMAELARAYTDVPVRALQVQELGREEAFDGIWACASLLHVPWDELPAVFRRLEGALRPGGVLYASFQVGSTERREGELIFTDMDPTRLADRASAARGLRLLETWVTADARPRRAGLRWLNALFERSGSEVPAR